MDLGRLLLRMLLGGLFVGHGTQKLFGWFGGGGPKETSEVMESVGLRPGRLHALFAGTTEAGSGALLAAGAATPLAAAGISGVMLTAVRRIHWKNGPWNTNGGWEYNGVILAALAALVEAGPGRLSVDAGTGSRPARLGLGARCARGRSRRLGAGDEVRAEGRARAGTRSGGGGDSGAGGAAGGVGPQPGSATRLRLGACTPSN